MVESEDTEELVDRSAVAELAVLLGSLNARRSLILSPSRWGEEKDLPRMMIGAGGGGVGALIQRTMTFCL